MADDPQHIIHKHIFDLEVDRRDRAQAVQSEVSRIFHEQLQTEIQKVIEELGPKAYDVQLEAIELDLGEIDESQLSKAFLQRIPRELRRALASQLTELELHNTAKPWLGKKRAHRQSSLQRLVHFLERGHFGAMSSVDQLPIVQQVGRVLEKDAKALFQAISRSALAPQMIERLFQSLKAAQRRQLFVHLLAHRVRTERLQQAIKRKTIQVENRLRAAQGKTQSRQSLRQQIEQSVFLTLLRSPQLSQHPEMVSLVVQEAEQQVIAAFDPFEQSLGIDRKDETIGIDREKLLPKTRIGDQPLQEEFPIEPPSPFNRIEEADRNQPPQDIASSSLPPPIAQLDYLDFLLAQGQVPWWGIEVAPEGPASLIQSLLEQSSKPLKDYIQTRLQQLRPLSSEANAWLQELLRWFSPQQQAALISLLESDFVGFDQTVQLLIQAYLQKHSSRSEAARKAFSMRISFHYLIAKQTNPYQPLTALQFAIEALRSSQKVSRVILLQQIQTWLMEQKEAGKDRFAVIGHLLPQVARKIGGESKLPRDSGPAGEKEEEKERQKPSSDIESDVDFWRAIEQSERPETSVLPDQKADHPADPNEELYESSASSNKLITLVQEDPQQFLAQLNYYFQQGSFPRKTQSKGPQEWEAALLVLVKQSPQRVRRFIQDAFRFVARKRIVRLFSAAGFLQISALFQVPKTVLQRFQKLVQLAQRSSSAIQAQPLIEILREHLLYFLLHPGTQKNQVKYLQNLLRYQARTQQKALLTVVVEWQERVQGSTGSQVAGNKSQGSESPDPSLSAPSSESGLAQDSLGRALGAIRLEVEQLPPAPKRPRSRSLQQQPQYSRRNKEDPIYIRNAGLVLLWPFVNFYFKQLDLIGAERDFKDETSRFRGALLLQYLATGKTESPEQDLVLNKVMCGIEIETPIPLTIDLTEQEEILSEKLFGAVKQQWSAVTNSTADGIRGSFLIREGRLTQKQENWYLRVEQKGFDLLLDRLPWGIGLIRYHWMPYLLHVEWR